MNADARRELQRLLPLCALLAGGGCFEEADSAAGVDALELVTQRLRGVAIACTGQFAMSACWHIRRTGPDGIPLWSVGVPCLPCRAYACCSGVNSSPHSSRNGVRHHCSGFGVHAFFTNFQHRTCCTEWATSARCRGVAIGVPLMFKGIQVELWMLWQRHLQAVHASCPRLRPRRMEDRCLPPAECSARQPRVARAVTHGPLSPIPLRARFRQTGDDGGVK